MGRSAASVETSTNYVQSTWNFIDQGRHAIGNAFGHFFSNLSAIIDDREVLVKSFRMIRHTMAAYFAAYGNHFVLARIDNHWDITINVLEGIQIVKALSIIFPEPNCNDEESLEKSLDSQEAAKIPVTFSERFTDWTGKATTIAFCIGDLAGGCVWLLDMQVPILGPYSKVVHIVRTISQIADGAILAGFTVEGLNAINQLYDFDGLDEVKKRTLLLLVAENTASVASLILGFVGVTAVPLTIGLGVAASSLGVVRFLYERHAR